MPDIGKREMTALIGVIVAITFGGIIISALLPVGINQINEDDTYNQTLVEGTETEIINGKLNATVTSSSTTTSPDQATIELKNVVDDNTASNTVQNGTTTSYTLDGETINVSVTDVDSTVSPNETTTSITVPPDFGWSDTSKTIWALFPLFFVLVVLLVVIGWAMRAM